MIDFVPRTLIDELVSKTNIVDIIHKRIPLKQQGSNFIACCPFHVDKNPSFTVSLEKQFYYCFSCKSYGNVISFLMNYDRLTFIESIYKLSIINNISIKYLLNPINNKDPCENSLHKFMNDLCDFYQKTLKSKKYIYAYLYLKSRGLTDNFIKQFNIGFAPPDWNHISQNFNLKLYNQRLIDQSGMFTRFQNKKYDRFRNRIMFPIRNSSGNIIAFGGRIIQYNSKIPKYLNSPDTKFFRKSQCLYGLYETQKKYKNIPYILLVEGYLDVITLNQFGIQYVVAVLGTSVTDNHIRLIYSITNQIICCYDGDDAGKTATWRTLNIALSYLEDGREIYFICLNDKEDPDTLIRKIGKNNFLNRLKYAKNLSHFLFETLSKKLNLQTLEGRVKLVKLATPLLHKIPGQILKLCLRQELGNKVGILDDHKLNQLITKKTIVKNNNKNVTNHIPYNIEHTLTGLLMQNPKLSKLVPTVSALKMLKNKKIIMFVNLIETCKLYPNLTTDQLLEYYRNNIKYQFFLYFEKLSNWNHMISNCMIEITFIDALTKLYDLILKNRQDMLIAYDRLSNLNKKERQELWELNQMLSKNYNNHIVS